MDPRLLRYYSRELQHIREMGGEFAKEYPKIAGRLGLEGFECADPYVERLLEGFGFLAARVQLRIDAEFPRFTQHLLELVYPHYLAPTPSMTVVQFQPDLSEGSLAEGFMVPRHSVLRSPLGKGEQTACEYRTAHDVTLWPLEIVEAEYFTHTRDLTGIQIPASNEVKAGIRLRLKTTAGLTFDKLPLDSLPVFLRGIDELPMHLYEQLVGNCVAVVLRPAERPAPWHQVLPKGCVRQTGFDDRQSLLPFSNRSFQGYRMLHEYFAFPERYMFVEFTGLSEGLRRCSGNELDLIVLLRRTDSALLNAVDASHFALFCSPAINLTRRRADRIHLREGQPEYHVVPDRTRPLDFEVYSVDGVVGHGTDSEMKQEFRPFYAAHDADRTTENRAYYTVRREPRVLSSKQRRQGTRSTYIGSEVFLSLVDGNQAPYRGDLRQLAMNTLCTNRDLPLQMPVGTGRTDFTLESGAPVQSVRCLAGPTKPRPSWAEGEVTWRLISHFSLNYLSLTDDRDGRGAAALRELLMLYGDIGEAPIRKQIEGVREIASVPIIRRVPTPGPMTFGRGLEVAVTFEEAAFEGTGVFLMGAILDRFFAQYASINSFTETVVKTLDRGEVMRWPVRIGRRYEL